MIPLWVSIAALDAELRGASLERLAIVQARVAREVVRRGLEGGLEAATASRLLRLAVLGRGRKQAPSR